MPDEGNKPVHDCRHAMARTLAPSPLAPIDSAVDNSQLTLSIESAQDLGRNCHPSGPGEGASAGFGRASCRSRAPHLPAQYPHTSLRAATTQRLASDLWVFKPMSADGNWRPETASLRTCRGPLPGVAIRLRSYVLPSHVLPRRREREVALCGFCAGTRTGVTRVSRTTGAEVADFTSRVLG